MQSEIGSITKWCTRAMHRGLDDCLFDMFEEMGVVIDKSNIEMLDLIIDETMKVAVARY